MGFETLAPSRKQVIVTSHSPELLDNKELDVDSILAVEAHDGTTAIAGVDDVSRDFVREAALHNGGSFAK